MWDNWSPDDVIALVCVVGLILLIALGYDGKLVTTFMGINALYLGEKRLRRARQERRTRPSTRSR